MKRRHFLKNAGALALGFAGLQRFVACGIKKLPPSAGYGPLVSDSNKIFDLPKDFFIKSFCAVDCTWTMALSCRNAVPWRE